MAELRTRPAARRTAQRGGYMVELIIVFPVVCLMILAAIQLGLMYQAKLTLGYAAFEGVREGSLNHGKPIPVSFAGSFIPVPDFAGGSILNGLALGMMPLFTHGTGLDDLYKAYQVAEGEVIAHACIDYLQPYQSSFLDWGIVELQNADRYLLKIPNDTLRYRKPLAYDLNTANSGDQKAPFDPDLVGPFSRISMQETNVLKIRVRYQYELRIPIINTLIVSLAAGLDTDPDAFSRNAYANGRLPIEAMATTRMQSTLYWHPFYPVGNFPDSVELAPNAAKYTAPLLNLKGSLAGSNGRSLQDTRLSFCMNPALIVGQDLVDFSGAGTDWLHSSNEPASKPQ